MRIITSVRYNKRDGEFIVTERDTVSGEKCVTYCNNLTDRERSFAKYCKNVYEDSDSVIWA